ncbi:DUF5590 domain-containing protein [Lysinibacillus sphaericus]|uniref:Cell wall elongation regulator TseB-like domain-containing protein n=1 Tax=Lysinibacillus sphaericus OT4b.31 TaxID=1285586 RepID=R7ZE70_LYSSH|nr:DUF5590 domain-containing protein [Lysinibacillus sphaericus]EON72430.1 hypothetical protein H131_09833 [Lysinibacillus sphaericus OT4b.31]
MKNWLIFISVFMVSLSLVISILVLWKAEAPFRSIEEQAEQLALDAKSLAVVSESYTYNGKNSYVTVFGVDEYGEKKAVFVPTNLEEDSIQEVFLKDGITEKQALSVFKNEGNVQKVLHMKLGYEEPGVVWEITYVNDHDNLNYVYILFENGDWVKRIKNL